MGCSAEKLSVAQEPVVVYVQQPAQVKKSAGIQTEDIFGGELGAVNADFAGPQETIRS